MSLRLVPVCLAVVAVTACGSIQEPSSDANASGPVTAATDQSRPTAHAATQPSPDLDGKVPDDDASLPRIGDVIPDSSGPAWVEGELKDADEVPVYVAVGLNGVIVGYTRTLWMPTSPEDYQTPRPIVDGRGREIGHFGPDGVAVMDK